MPVIVIAIPKPKFPLGQVVITANAQAKLDSQAVSDGLSRHASGDWGNVGRKMRAENELSLKEGYRLLSAYGSGETKFWIITEADRTYTTVLMPEDY